MTIETPQTAVQSIARLLGGVKTLGTRPATQLEAHELLMAGLPGAALDHLIEKILVLQKPAALEQAIGMSLRTFQRRKESPSKPLNADQSGRTWKFAEILAKATSVLGSQEEAERWLERPCMALDRHRPIDLLATPAGVELVETFLERAKYGVYM